MKTIKDFDLNISKPLKKLIEISKREHPNKDFYTKVIFWDDNDYKIELTHNNIPIRYIYSYKKLTNEYKSEVVKIITTHAEELISEIKHIFDFDKLFKK